MMNESRRLSVDSSRWWLSTSILLIESRRKTRTLRISWACSLVVADAPDSKENADPEPRVSEQVEIEYVPEQPEFEDGFSDEFKQIFEKFSFKEPFASEDDTKKDEYEENKDVKKNDNSDSEADEEDQGNEQKEKGISNKQKKV